MIGKTFFHYKILEKLGEGGMGVVYLGEDTKLERRVAIKFLPRHIARNSEERKRFEIEAKAAAALNHPNIATIHAIEDHDDELFIVMEYINGKELKEIIEAPLADTQNRADTRPGLAIDEIIDYATKIAKGLKAAHDQDIVHRDIKSANIMVTEEGQVKIMDFGLAKVRGGALVTKVGTTLGTAAYMSPEQARGEDVDNRSDIWSFGVVLFRMLTGKFPFPGDYEQAVIYAILNEKPDYPDNLPANLKPILEKILVKDAAKRYQHIDELLSDLKLTAKNENSAPAKSVLKAQRQRKQVYLYVGIAIVAIVLGGCRIVWTVWSKESDNNSIAVLPLENMSADPNQDYFADGMTEALIMNLSKIHNLKVISRTSVMQYKQIKKPLPAIAEELGVKAVIEGSVLRVENKVRISTRLMDAANDQQIWAKTYERDLENVLVLQSEVARDVVKEIQVKLSTQEESRLTGARAVNPQAHEAYLKGRYHWNKRTTEALLKSVEYYDQAIKHDPEYALAYAGLADSYNFLHIYGSLSGSNVLLKSKLAALRAIELDPNIGEAYNSLALIIYHYDRDREASEEAFKRAIELNPGYALAHHWYAIFLAETGNHREALVEIRKAKELDPLSLIINTNEAWPILFFARKYDQAVLRLLETLNLDPNYWITHHWLGAVYTTTGNYDQAISSIQKAMRLSGDNSLPLSMLGYAYAKSGNVTKAMETLAHLQERRLNQEYISPYEIAVIYTGLDQKEQAFQWLETACQQHDAWLKCMNGDPRLDPLRGDRRFSELLQKITALGNGSKK